jgi:alginate O-acetyltransferase complex protein AlgI
LVFSSLNFLFVFLPGVLAAYYVAPRRWRNGVLVIASLAFYTYGGGVLVVLVLISAAVDYVAGRLVARARALDSTAGMKAGVTFSVVANLGLLGYFKYANFLVEQLNALGSQLGFGSIAWTSVVLPIGISFYTFQSMSYTIDVARGRVSPVRSPLDFLLYISLFPQLIAGPIVRFHEIADEIPGRTTSVDDFAEGIVRFAHGLVKKVVVADAVALVVEPVFALDPGRLTTTAAWLGVLAYTIQIYFDFSGYSDMAIGLGRMFGFHFPENFRRPYSALSITDFWRRWHITLSNWLRDYLFIPLGGSRISTAGTYRNLAVVFLLTGLWHGAAWTFVIWGAFHGLLLVAERVTGQRPVGDDAPNSWPRRAYTMFAVMLGWVVFRSETLEQAGSFLKAMFTPSGTLLPPEVSTVLTTRVQITLALALLVVFLPRTYVTGTTLTSRVGRLAAAGRLGLMLLGFPFAVALVAVGTFSPFIYYQF